MNKLDFKTVADAALVAADNLLAEWLPGGKYKGHEYVVCNPLRADHRPNSFSINTHSGLWSDFATGDDGGDLISLYAYLFTGGKQGAALRAVAERLRIGGFEPVQRVAWDGGYAAGSKSKRDDWEPVIPVPEKPELQPAVVNQTAKDPAKTGLDTRISKLKEQISKVEANIASTKVKLETATGKKAEKLTTTLKSLEKDLAYLQARLAKLTAV